MFKKIKDKRIFEKIVDQIREAVLTEKLKVGDKLPSESELANIFGVSRAAVREALRILELSGIIIIKQGVKGGAFIQQANTNQKLKDYFSDNLRLGHIDIFQLTEARYWIESIIIDIVGRKGTKRDFENIRSSIDKAERLFREGRECEKIYENFYFHILLAEITKNSILIDNISCILELMSYIMLKIRPTAKISENTFKFHREILESLISGDLERAKEINRNHINDVSTRLIKKHSAKKKTLSYLGEQSFGEIEKYRVLF